MVASLSDAPTAYAMALCWALLPDEDQRSARRTAAGGSGAHPGFRISTGFVGTPLIADALPSTGHVDVAYRLLSRPACPSWLYSVTMGATTIWERWDSMLPDGSINPGEMTSFNHYALGAVADWLHRSVAGLAPTAPGYREIHIAAAGRWPAHGRGCSASHAVRRSQRLVDALRAPTISSTRSSRSGPAQTIQLPGRPEVLRVGHGHHVWTGDLPVAELSERPRTVRSLMDEPRDGLGWSPQPWRPESPRMSLQPPSV